MQSRAEKLKAEVTVKQSGKTQGEKVTVIVSSERPRKFSILALFPIRFRDGFWPVFWPKSTGHAALFFSSFFLVYSPVFWFFLVTFWFFRLFLVPPFFYLILVPLIFRLFLVLPIFCFLLVLPKEVSVKQSGKTRGESDCKAERKNSRRK